ncbi:MAG: hypothetical protein VX834_05530 [Myxococcota bacterium]|nr:hypothetical protein [Myxococcota bacterium]
MAQHFDVIIIGGELPGRLMAGLLTRAGRRVLVLDQGECIPHYEHEGWVLPKRSDLLPDPDGSVRIRNIHRTLGFHFERSERSDERPLYQVVLPKHRFKLFAARPQRERELGRIKLSNPQSETLIDALNRADIALDQYLASEPLLAPLGWFEHFKAKRQWQRALPAETTPEITPHPVNDALLAPEKLLSFLQPDNESTARAARLTSLFFQGIHPRGADGDSFDAQLNERLVEMGVEFQVATPIDSIQIKWGKLKSILLKKAGETLTADFFVANTLLPLEELLEGKYATRSYLKRPESLALCGGLLHLNLVVHQDVIPEGMSERVLLQTERGPLLLQLSPARRAPSNRQHDPFGQRDADHVTLTLSRSTKVDELQAGSDRLAEIEKELHQELSTVIPFLESHVVTSSFAVNQAGTAPNLKLHPYYSSVEALPLGFVGRSVRTRYRNLLHVGHDVLPGLGFEGLYITAQEAAARLTKLAGRKWREPRS